MHHFSGWHTAGGHAFGHISKVNLERGRKLHHNAGMRRVVSAAVLALGWMSGLFAVTPPSDRIEAGSKLYIDSSSGLSALLGTAFDKAQIPFTIVDDKEKADYTFLWVPEGGSAGGMRLAKVSGNAVIFACTLRHDRLHGPRSQASGIAEMLRERFNFVSGSNMIAPRRKSAIKSLLATGWPPEMDFR